MVLSMLKIGMRVRERDWKGVDGVWKPEMEARERFALRRPLPSPRPPRCGGLWTVDAHRLLPSTPQTPPLSLWLCLVPHTLQATLRARSLARSRSLALSLTQSTHTTSVLHTGRAAWRGRRSAHQVEEDVDE
eukprot:3941496-Rhodomonas_salina.1